MAAKYWEYVRSSVCIISILGMGFWGYFRGSATFSPPPLAEDIVVNERDDPNCTADNGNKAESTHNPARFSWEDYKALYLARLVNEENFETLFYDVDIEEEYRYSLAGVSLWAASPSPNRWLR